MRQMAAACMAGLLVVAAIVPLAHADERAARLVLATFEAGRFAGNDRVRASVSPRLARAPALLRIEAIIERSDENRALEFVVNSPDYFRRSTVALDGARSARVHAVEFRSTPAGEYDVRVALMGTDGDVRAAIYHRVTVVD